MSVRHVIHDNERCRLVVEVDVGWVVLTLFFGRDPIEACGLPGHGFSSHASVHLSPADARDRAVLAHAIEGLERVAGSSFAHPTSLERRVPLDVLHRSVMDVTRRPTAMSAKRLPRAVEEAIGRFADALQTNAPHVIAKEIRPTVDAIEHDLLRRLAATFEVLARRTRPDATAAGMRACAEACRIYIEKGSTPAEIR